jgi:2-haloacid dehalogenase
VNEPAEIPELDLDLSLYDVVTFDCYGTLVDWETGILSVLQPLLDRHGCARGRDEVLQLYAQAEAELERGTYQPYRDVLNEVVRMIGELLGFPVTDDEASALATSLPDWPLFEDTLDALDRLGRHVKLGVISNVDDELFAGTQRHLGNRFEWITTAGQAQAYKPSLDIFKLAMSRIEVHPEAILHAGQSLYHDVVPAQAMGMATVLVTRRGRGATLETEAKPDLLVPDLATLAGHFEAANAV